MLLPVRGAHDKARWHAERPHLFAARVLSLTP